MSPGAGASEVSMSATKVVRKAPETGPVSSLNTFVAWADEMTVLQSSGGGVAGPAALPSSWKTPEGRPPAGARRSSRDSSRRRERAGGPVRCEARRRGRSWLKKREKVRARGGEVLVM